MLRIQFTGYIGADCRTRQENENVAITFSVGVSKQYKNRQGVTVSKTTWVGCTLWRKADNLGSVANFLTKGKQVLVEGEPSARAWINPTDGMAKCSLDCRVVNIELLGKNNASAETPAPTNTSENINTEGDDLPF